jgi:hypothetical protein
MTPKQKILVKYFCYGWEPQAKLIFHKKYRIISWDKKNIVVIKIKVTRDKKPSSVWCDPHEW